MTTRILIAKEFSDVPAGRHMQDGEFSGERFRCEFLESPLRKRQRVVVVLDNVMGFGSSFLEEAFGGLVRNNIATAAQLSELLTIEANQSSHKRYIEAINRYIVQASQAVPDRISA